MRKYVALAVLIFFSFSACSKDYKIETNLSPKEVVEVQKNIVAYEKDIQKLKAEKSSSIYMKLVDLATSHQALGDYGKAIDVYENALAEGYENSIILHNLAKLYEQVDDYKKAIKMYEQILAKYPDNNYFLDIALAYMKVDDVEKTKTYYLQWKSHSGQTDGFIEDYLKAHETK